MIIVTSGFRYLDIDAYACCVAYAELLQLLGEDAKAVSTAPLNESITPSLRALPASVTTAYKLNPDDTFVITDISEPDMLDPIVDPGRVTEVFDHHPGFEAYWTDKLGGSAHIEFIGAAATLIFEQWQQAGKLPDMSQASAQLIAAGILDNTLNFGAKVTTDRDRAAYQALATHAGLDDAWIADYFSECQQSIEADLVTAVRNDTKFAAYPGLPDELCVGQLVVWDARSLIADSTAAMRDVWSDMRPQWFANIVSISEGCSYFMCEDETIKKWLGDLLGVTFDGTIAKAERLWLRKEIMKAAQSNASVSSSLLQ